MTLNPRLGDVAASADRGWNVSIHCRYQLASLRGLDSSDHVQGSIEDRHTAHFVRNVATRQWRIFSVSVFSETGAQSRMVSTAIVPNEGSSRLLTGSGLGLHPKKSYFSLRECVS